MRYFHWWYYHDYKSNSISQVLPLVAVFVIVHVAILNKHAHGYHNSGLLDKTTAVSSCITQDGELYITMNCSVGKVVVFTEIMSSYVSNSSHCVRDKTTEPLCFPSSPDLILQSNACNWKKNDCTLRDQEQKMLCEDFPYKFKESNFLIAMDFQCVPEHKVTDICSTDIADNLVTTPSGYILTPEYPKSLPSSPEPCIKILTNNNGDFASFTIISLDFQLVDSVLCNEEDVEYLKISYVDGYNQLVSMYYCGKNTLINVTILAYEVTLELKRESGVGNPGFLLEYEVENATEPTLAPLETTTPTTSIEITEDTPQPTTTPSQQQPSKHQLKIVLILFFTILVIVILVSTLLLINICRKKPKPETCENSIEPFDNRIVKYVNEQYDYICTRKQRPVCDIEDQEINPADIQVDNQSSHCDNLENSSANNKCEETMFQRPQSDIEIHDFYHDDILINNQSPFDDTKLDAVSNENRDSCHTNTNSEENSPQDADWVSYISESGISV